MTEKQQAAMRQAIEALEQWNAPSYKRHNAITALREALPAFERQIRGFARPDAVLTGVETRTSSPVRIPRGRDYQSLQVQGLYPAGEGAGYAGGIMSAGVDGIVTGRADALAGLRANEARYFKNKYDTDFVTQPAAKATKLVKYVAKVLAEERGIVIDSPALEATELNVDGIRWT